MACRGMSAHDQTVANYFGTNHIFSRHVGGKLWAGAEAHRKEVRAPEQLDSARNVLEGAISGLVPADALVR